MAWARPALTLGWAGTHCQPRCLVAHPLRAAFARDLNPPRVGAVPAGQPDVLAAQGHAGEAAVLAAAAHPAVGLEGLPVPVPAAVYLTAPVVRSPCGGETGPPLATPNFPWARLLGPRPPHGWPVCRAGWIPRGRGTQGKAGPSQHLSTARGLQPVICTPPHPTRKTAWPTASWHSACERTELG